MEKANFMGYELIEKIKNKEIKILEHVEEKFNRIEETEHLLHSFVRLFKEQALIKARQLDDKLKRGKSIGRLLGLSIAIDDGICVKNCPTTCCSNILQGYNPPFNATVVEKLLEQESAINIGSTNMDEFAMGTSTETSCYGPTYNPWNLNHVPGGASGGSGSCIASNQSIFSLGSDMGGSLRCPASYCGVVGLKPTFGRVSKFGLASYGNSLEQIGPIVKCVHDCALLLEIIAGQDPLDPTTADKKVDKYTEELEKSIDKKTIGVPIEFFEDNIDPIVRKSVNETIDVLKSLGAKIIQLSFPYLEYSTQTYYLIALSEEASNLAKFDGLRYGKMSDNLNGDVFDVFSRTRGEKLGLEAKRRAMLGAYILTEDYYEILYVKALKVRMSIKKEFQKIFKQCDSIVCPTMPTTAFKIDELKDNPLKMYQMNYLTCPANVAGLPALTLPCGFDNKELPIGVQIIGNYFDEKGILNIGYSLEQELNIFRKNPKINK